MVISSDVVSLDFSIWLSCFCFERRISRYHSHVQADPRRLGETIPANRQEYAEAIVVAVTGVTIRTGALLFQPSAVNAWLSRLIGWRDEEHRNQQELRTLISQRQFAISPSPLREDYHEP